MLVHATKSQSIRRTEYTPRPSFGCYFILCLGLELGLNLALHGVWRVAHKMEIRETVLGNNKCVHLNDSHTRCFVHDTHANLNSI